MNNKNNSSSELLNIHNPLEYIGLVEHINSNNFTIFENAAIKFESASGINLDQEETAILLVGSDGKGERHCQSKTEIIVVNTTGNTNISIGFCVFLDQYLKDNELEMHLDLDNPVEQGFLVQNYTQSSPLSYARGNPDTIYPDVLLNSTLIRGNAQLHVNIKDRILREMSENDSHGIRIVKHMQKQLSQYRGAMRTGYFRGAQLFDKTEGIQYYQESKPYSFGFKTSHLRAVQRKVDLICCGDKIKKTISISDLAKELPSSTIGKIELFSKLNVISPENAESVAEAYAWFLMQYHTAQEIYKNTKERAEVLFYPAEFEHYHKKVHDFVS